MDNKICFVIMPIGNSDKTHTKEYFRTVYEDIFFPAIIKSGFIPQRADDNKSSSIIHFNIIRDIINAPMALCDLTTRNPNVLFELGIRQAFDLPVAIVQEDGTPRIFDIENINTISYGKGFVRRRVLEDIENIANVIKATFNDKTGINSIIKLLQIKASVKEIGEDEKLKLMFNTILNKIDYLEDNTNILLDEYQKKLYDEKVDIGVNEKIQIYHEVYEKYTKELNEYELFLGKPSTIMRLEKIEQLIKKLELLQENIVLDTDLTSSDQNVLSQRCAFILRFLIVSQKIELLQKKQLNSQDGTDSFMKS